MAAVLAGGIFLSGCQQKPEESLSIGSLFDQDDTTSQQESLSDGSSSSADTESSVQGEESSLQGGSESSDSSQASQSGASHTHQYTAAVTSPTCTSGGYTTYTCSCGSSYTGNETAALGHSFSDWVVTVQATASSEGRKERTCTRCGYQEAQSIPRTGGNTAFASQVIQIVNEERAKNGLPPLQAANDLNAFAYTRSTELPALFAHQRPDGSDPLYTVLEYGYMAAGENIASGYPTPQAVMEGWMNSEGHRANILNSGFRYIGVGCYLNNGVYYWTQIFGG